MEKLRIMADVFLFLFGVWYGWFLTSRVLIKRSLHKSGKNDEHI
ncbi:unnamed protein product [marine sediment metagenome]|uniref:Uncharacterized protein n=1 Tax=marine sediment metagenome TaxID=412755 RepID=X0YQD0_9ZZZZ